jgi:hypothetical protein
MANGHIRQDNRRTYSIRTLYPNQMKKPLEDLIILILALTTVALYWGFVVWLWNN